MQEARQQLVSELAGAPAKSSKSKKTQSSSAKRVINRLTTSNLTLEGEESISGSEWIRRYDAQCDTQKSAKEVVAAAAEIGLKMEPSLVYNIRQQLNKRQVEQTEQADAEAEAEVKAKKEASLKKIRQENAAKARKAKAEKAKREAEAAAASQVVTAEKVEESPAPEVVKPEAPVQEETVTNAE